MKFLWGFAICSILISCQKLKDKKLDHSNENMDLRELLNSDDYFKSRKKKNLNSSDSLETRLVKFGDLNADGSNDSAWVTYNNLTSTYSVRFTCFPGTITDAISTELHLKDVGDLNGDGKNEILFFLMSEESCWDEIKLYSYLDRWVEKYDGLTYQCSDNHNYEFRKINDRTVQITTYGINKDSLDISGDTLENIIPNARNQSLINW